MNAAEPMVSLLNHCSNCFLAYRTALLAWRLAGFRNGWDERYDLTFARKTDQNVAVAKSCHWVVLVAISVLPQSLVWAPSAVRAAADWLPAADES